MKMRIAAFVLAIVISGLGCRTVTPSRVDKKTHDDGYFLSLKQKGQLIGTGQIRDGQGNRYDVWIVPGYVQPAQRAKASFRQVGRDLCEYVQPRKYRDLVEASSDALEWAYSDCLTDFTVKGVPRAWSRYWTTANRRTKQRVFGWWLAYPWALMESVVDTCFRIPVGLTGTALGTAWGVAVVPSYYAVNSSAKGAWHLAVDTVLFPTVACSWNTVVAPPLALVGQKPAPSRADGFWLRQVHNPAAPSEIEALAAWGHLLLTASRPYDEQRHALREQIEAEREAIRRRSELAEADIASEEEASIRAIVIDPSQQETINYLQGRGFDATRISRTAADLRRHLEGRKDLSQEEINRTLDLLIRHPPSSVIHHSPPRPKTDPLQHSLDLIGDLQ